MKPEPPGTLEIEFEDEDAAATGHRPAAKLRDLRPAALCVLAAATLAAATLGAALYASYPAVTHDTAAAGTGRATATPAAVPDFSAYVVTVAYQRSQMLSTARRRIELDLRVTPVAAAKVRVIAYSVSENGVSTTADPPPSSAPLPRAGADVRLELTVNDCAVVPIGETMAFVDVVADGPAGVIDRFTILGERYSADLARLLRQACPGRSGGADQGSIGVIVAGS